MRLNMLSRYSVTTQFFLLLLTLISNLFFIALVRKANQQSYVKKQPGPLILFWGFPWNDVSEGVKDGSRIGQCTVTYDRELIKDAKAVVFHYTTIRKRDIPWKYYRGSDQVFVWQSAEAPAIVKEHYVNLRNFDGFFNWTWTYRRDADVRISYGVREELINNLDKGKKAVDKIMAGKTKMAMWVVSGCRHTGGAISRMKLATELSKAGVEISRYGQCGRSKRLPKGNLDALLSEVKKHKFYFAFENAHLCKDYVTEKFWINGFHGDAVPVVWGAPKDDVIGVAPIDSFIFADDFESPRKLAEYLMFLDSNDKEYRKYFRWREDKGMTDEKMIEMVKEKYPGVDVQTRSENLCDKLLKNNTKKVVRSLQEEFMEANPTECGIKYFWYEHIWASLCDLFSNWIYNMWN